MGDEKMFGHGETFPMFASSKGEEKENRTLFTADEELEHIRGRRQHASPCTSSGRYGL